MTAGPSLRTDLVFVLIARRRGADAAPEFLQLRRVDGRMQGTFQPVMGGVHRGERAEDAAWRELGEETGLSRAAALAAWHLDRPCVFFWPDADAVWICPGFLVEAPPDWEPTLNEEHDTHRWCPAAEVNTLFFWQGHKDAAHEALRVMSPGSAHGAVQRRP